MTEVESDPEDAAFSGQHQRTDSFVSLAIGEHRLDIGKPRFGYSVEIVWRRNGYRRNAAYLFLSQ